MNTAFSLQPARWLFLLLFALGCLLMFAPAGLAADLPSNGEAISLTPTIQANILQELVGNRTRLIQVSLVCVVLGCSLLWWKR
jgi:hypothetical protein